MYNNMYRNFAIYSKAKYYHVKCVNGVTFGNSVYIL
jgi:hypothetical protein